MKSASALRVLARHVELEACVRRLLGYLFPGRRPELDRSGRYTVLEDAIEAYPALLAALRDDEQAAAVSVWADCLADHATDIQFHHALAVIYREEALAEMARDGQPGHLLTIATGLWGLILETKAFWSYQETPGRPLRRPDSETALTETVARELLAVHLAHGDRALTAGRQEVAAMHLACLAACRAGPQALVDLLAEHGLPYAHTVERRPGRVAALAGEVISSWCNDIIRLARQAADDAEVIRKLPAGIKKNYEGAIRIVEAFARLGVAEGRILTVGLEWYNDWSYCYYTLSDTDQIKRLLGPAHVLATQMEPLCVKGRGHVPANQLLSRHYLLRGFVASDPDVAQREFQEALEWDPADSNAADLWQESVESVAFQRHEIALKQALESRDWTRVYGVVEIALASSSTDSSRNARARALSTMLNNHAVKILNDGPAVRGAARTLLEKAISLDPGNRTAASNLAAT